MKSRLSDDFLLNSLRLALNFLNRFLVEPSSNNNGRTSSHGKSSNDNDRNCCEDDVASLASKLKQAYAYFDSTEATITRDQLRKSFKRLSLIYHPDRNANSPESVQEMQKINQYYTLLQEELDRQEDGAAGGRASASKPQQAASSVNAQEKEEAMNRHQQQPTCQDTEKDLRKGRGRQHDEQAQQQREREHELRREWEESQRRMRDFQAQRDQLRRSNRRSFMNENLDTAWGRDHAHQLYMIAVQKYQEQLTQRKQQEQLKHSRPTFEKQNCFSKGLQSFHAANTQSGEDDKRCTSVSYTRGTDVNDPAPMTNQTASNPTNPMKPRNPLMEYCNENAVVAMRLRETDVAVAIVHEEMRSATEQWLSFKLREPSASFHDRNNGFSVSLDNRYYRHIFRTLMRPLDEERNSILHYAVYLEDHDMISFLVQVARRYNLFPEFMTYKNIHCLAASEYARSCSEHSSLPDLIASLMEEARLALEEKKFGKASQRMIQESLLQRPSFFPLFRTMTCLALSRYAFGSSWVASLLLTALATYCDNLEENRHKRNRISWVPHFLTVHIIWFLSTMACTHGWKAIWSIIDSLPFPWEFQILGIFIFPFTIKARYVTKILQTLSDCVVLTHHSLTFLVDSLLGTQGAI